ncbi:MAG: hypothetical protein AB1813_01590 [Verrucomicrobiota bacterium]
MTPDPQRDSMECFRATADVLAECLRFLTEDHTALNRPPDWIRDPRQGGLDVTRLRNVLAAAQSELKAFDDHCRGCRPPRLAENTEQRENDIFTCCGLRFDGYRYIEMSGFDAEGNLEQAFKTQSSPKDELQRLTLFFVLQRILFKWGGEREPRDGRYWRLFRELFLQVAPLHVPVEFRPQDDSWRLRRRYVYRPRLDETIAFVQNTHSNTPYRDV